MNNILIFCPKNHQEEKKYILTTLFQDLLGIPVQISFAEKDNYEFIIGDKKIIFADAFFSKFREPLSYLNVGNIPDTLIIEKTLGVNIPLIWGTNKCIIGDKEICIGNDVLATAFFFLTQWEEYVLKVWQGLGVREKVNEKLLFIVRNGLQKKCLVNDILEFLKVLLKMCGIEQFQTYHFNVMLTHDVDRCYLSSYEELCGNIYQMLKTGESEKAQKILGDYLSYQQQGINPFNSFNELMTISEQNGFKNHFYFKPCVAGDEGITYSIYDDFVVKAINNILSRGHYIGLHASENTSLSYNALEKEYDRLLEVSKNEIAGGRTHGLIYSYDIFENMERLGLKYDSGIGFQYYNGFRSSVCYPYSMFDIERRKKLTMKQYPFMVMDSVSVRNNMNAEKFFEDTIAIINMVKKYNGVFVMNWHSNMFDAKGREGFKKIYCQMVELLRKTCETSFEIS